MSAAISFGARCSALAAEHPDRAALIFVPNDGQTREVTWAELDTRSNQMAHLLAERGADHNSLVIVALPSCVEHYFASFGAWKVGACVLPLHHQLPDHERDNLLKVGSEWRPVVVVGDWEFDKTRRVSGADLQTLDEQDSAALPDVVPQPGRAIGSGGSTGKPKIIIDPKPFSHIPGCWGPLTHIGLRSGQTMLLTGRLYHAMGFELSHVCLFEGHTVIVPQQFDAARTIDLIEKYRVQFLALLPIMMQRIAKLEGIENRDFSSIESVYHAGGACSEWLKRKWLKLVAPEKQWEMYGSTEAKGLTLVGGKDWLQHPGTVGKAFASEIKVFDEHGKEVADGEIGEIHMRNRPPPDTPPGGTWPQDPTFEYVGAAPAKTAGSGLTSVGDMGHIDTDGFIYLADRRVDMINSGGSNIYPAEIEAVLSELKQVSDAVVIGVPDEQWGSRVHALIELAPGEDKIGVNDLDRFCREHLVNYKAPKSYEFVQQMPRDETGKIRRAALREERSSGWIDGMIAAPTSQKPSTTHAGNSA